MILKKLHDFIFPPAEARPNAHPRKIFLAAAAFLLTALPVRAGYAQTNAAPPPAAAPLAGRDISGVYWADTYSAKIQPVGGGDPPYTQAAMATYKKNIVALKANALDDKARSLCLPDGVPRILENPYPFEVFQSPNRGEIHLLYELNHVIRLVSMDKPMPSEKELSNLPFYSGHSFGHWEGDTLVVQTAGFNDATFLDNSGAPHTDQLRTLERIRKIDDGKELEDVVTIHDPGVFTKDWSARFVYVARPELRIMDYNCGEKHRDLSRVKGVQAR
jgi:hypothetical protein